MSGGGEGGPRIEPTRAQFERLASSTDPEPIVMVNLLRFRDRAAGEDAVSGAEAYARYGEAIGPHLERVGGRLLAAVACVESLIGPDEAEWDVVALVSYPSRAAFLEMVADPGYLEITVDRAAGLADTRLIVSKLAPPPG